MICGRYSLPLYKGAPAKELFYPKLQVRKTLKSLQTDLLLGTNLVVKLVDVNDDEIFSGLPSLHHCYVANNIIGRYVTIESED